MISLPFRLEYRAPDGRWFGVPGDQDNSKLYLLGRMDARRERSPRVPCRLVRHRDGKVLAEDAGAEGAEVGMVAGYATAGQLIRAATRALEQVREVDDGDVYAPTVEERGRVDAALAALRGGS